MEGVAMTDWKSTPKIDAHIHILPDAVIAANQGVDDPYILAGGIDEYVHLMDENNITHAIVMPFNDPFLMSMEFSISAVHQNLMDFQKRYPTRFLLFADIDVRNSIEDTLTELSRVMASGAFSGIKIHPANTDMPLDCSYYDAVFSYAEVNRIPVEIHSYPKENAPEDVCSSQRLHQVLVKHPSLRVSVAHLGGFQFSDLYNENVWVNISAVLPDLVARFGVEEANRILRKFHIDRLIFASDYPGSRCLDFGGIYPRYFEILDKMDFTASELEKICTQNILRFLNIVSES